MTWTVPNVDGSLLATLPWTESQTALAGTALDPRSGQLLSLGWHGTNKDSRRGAFALVDADGPAAALVGHQVRILDPATSRVVFAYVAAAVTDLLDDITLTRRGFLELAPLWTTALPVRVEATT